MNRDTAGDHHRVIDPAEAQCSEHNRGHERGHRKANECKDKGKGRRVKFEEACPIQEVYRGDPKERKFHMNVPLGRAVRRPAKNVVAKQEMIALPRQWKRYTIFVIHQVASALEGQDVHDAPSVTDSSTPPLVGNDHLLQLGSSIHLYPGDSGWKSCQEASRQS